MTRVNGWLLLLVLVLAGILLYSGKKPPLATIAPEQVSRIELEKPGEKSILLQKRQGKWYFVSADSRLADSQRVARLLELLRANPSRRLEPGDLSRYGLDRPSLRIAFDGQWFAFGNLNPLTREQYLKTATGVYLIAPLYAAAATEDFIQGRR